MNIFKKKWVRLFIVLSVLYIIPISFCANSNLKKWHADIKVSDSEHLKQIFSLERTFDVEAIRKVAWSFASARRKAYGKQKKDTIFWSINIWIASVVITGLLIKSILWIKQGK